VLTTSSLTREQIDAEIAEMRKAARTIAGSPGRQREFLRRIGVLNATGKPARPTKKPNSSARNGS